MSTIKVNKIEHTGTTAGGVEIDSSGHVQVDGQQIPTDGPLSNRNMIINGDMRVAQRGTTKTGLGNGDTGYYTVDRFEWQEAGTVSFVQTMSQSTDAPPGFSNSLKVETTTADAAFTSSETNKIQYVVEGQDLQHLGYGTSAAKSITLSFWVKSSETGTYVIWLYNADNTSSCTQTYTINAADTWEYKTVTIAGSTTKAFNNDPNFSLSISWILASGPNYTSGTASSTWVASITAANRYVGHTANVTDTVGKTWQMTGVQLEVGEKATPFEHRSYGDELARCQRYHLQIPAETQYYLAQTTNGYTRLSLLFPQTMRATPTVSATGWSLSSTTHAVTGYYSTQGNATLPAITATAEL